MTSRATDGCFRKENVLNVGLGREDNRNIADHVRRFCDWLAARGRIPRDMPSKFKGHAYILHGRSRRISSGDGIVLAGDAIGLAYDRSGEGIRPAVESAVIAAEIIARAGGSFDETTFAGYEGRLRERFGERGGRRAACRTGSPPGCAGRSRGEAARHGLVLAPLRPRRVVPPPAPAPSPRKLIRGRGARREPVRRGAIRRARVRARTAAARRARGERRMRRDRRRASPRRAARGDGEEAFR